MLSEKTSTSKNYKIIEKSDSNKIFFDKNYLFYFFIVFFFVLTIIFALNPKLLKNFKTKVSLKRRSFFKNKFKFKLKKNIVLKNKTDFFYKNILKFLTLILNTFILDNSIYQEQINKKIEEDEESISFCCKHYFLNLEEGETLILTENFPEFKLFAGMSGQVKKVFFHQKVELVFYSSCRFYTSSQDGQKYDFSKCQTCFIKKSDLAKLQNKTF